MRVRCCKCSAMAQWMYMPSDRDGNYCDSCVSRRCSCNFDPDTGIEDQDEAGRFLPCCEYMYSETGFDDDKPLNDSDKYDEQDSPHYRRRWHNS